MVLKGGSMKVSEIQTFLEESYQDPPKENILGCTLDEEISKKSILMSQMTARVYVKEDEKKVISENATVGIYFWKKGSDYVKYAKQMINKNIRVNNEFYVCPVFNEAIKDNKVIKIKKIDKMWGLGTPEDLDFFHKNFKKSI